MILLACLVGGVLVIIAAILIPGWLTDRAQRADSRQPRHRDTGRDIQRLRDHAARRQADNVIPRAQVKGSPPWQPAPVMTAAPAAPRNRPATLNGSPPWPVQPTLPAVVEVSLGGGRTTLMPVTSSISEGGQQWLSHGPGPVTAAGVSSSPASVVVTPPSSPSSMTTSVPTFPTAEKPSETLAARYRRIFPGDVPDQVAAILGHGGPREQAVDAAVESCFTKAMARQVAEAVSGDA